MREPPPDHFIRIANQAGLYDALWRPEQTGDVAGDLRRGLLLLRQSPWFWSRFGDRLGLLAIVEERLRQLGERGMNNEPTN